MPPVIAAIGPILASIGGGSAAAGAATAAGLALTATEGIKALTSGGAPKPSPYPTTQQVGAQKNQLASVVQQNLGNLQEAGGGGLSPNYLAETIGSGTGNLNNINELQDLIAQFTGGGGGGGGGGSSNFSQLSIPTQGTASLSGGPGLADSDIFGGANG